MFDCCCCSVIFMLLLLLSRLLFLVLFNCCFFAFSNCCCSCCSLRFFPEEFLPLFLLLCARSPLWAYSPFGVLVHRGDAKSTYFWHHMLEINRKIVTWWHMDLTIYLRLSLRFCDTLLTSCLFMDRICTGTTRTTTIEKQQRLNDTNNNQKATTITRRIIERQQQSNSINNRTTTTIEQQQSNSKNDNQARTTEQRQQQWLRLIQTSPSSSGETTIEAKKHWLIGDTPMYECHLTLNKLSGKVGARAVEKYIMNRIQGGGTYCSICQVLTTNLSATPQDGTTTVKIHIRTDLELVNVRKVFKRPRFNQKRFWMDIVEHGGAADGDGVGRRVRGEDPDSTHTNNDGRAKFFYKLIFTNLTPDNGRRQAVVVVSINIEAIRVRV